VGLGDQHVVFHQHLEGADALIHLEMFASSTGLPAARLPAAARAGAHWWCWWWCWGGRDTRAVATEARSAAARRMDRGIFTLLKGVSYLGGWACGGLGRWVGGLVGVEEEIEYHTNTQNNQRN